MWSSLNARVSQCNPVITIRNLGIILSKDDETKSDRPPHSLNTSFPHIYQTSSVTRRYPQLPAQNGDASTDVRSSGRLSGLVGPGRSEPRTRQCRQWLQATTKQQRLHTHRCVERDEATEDMDRKYLASCSTTGFQEKGTMIKTHIDQSPLLRVLLSRPATTEKNYPSSIRRSHCTLQPGCIIPQHLPPPHTNSEVSPSGHPGVRR